MTKKHLEDTKIAFSEVADSQEDKGIEKYGKPLNPLDNYDWLDMEFEELIDAAKYNRAEKIKRQHIVGRIRKLLLHVDAPKVIVGEINRLLDELEGVAK
ncbi:hypothetical protein JYK21_03780 [Ralstonia pickettii]|nr:hypothetical protein [Ralstonia pickettii]